MVDEAKPNAFGDALGLDGDDEDPAVVEGPDALLLDSRDDGVFSRLYFYEPVLLRTSSVSAAEYRK